MISILDQQEYGVVTNDLNGLNPFVHNPTYTFRGSIEN